MIFYPKSYFKNILEIDMNFIEKNNIKAILLDIDNTMIDTDNNILEGLEDWVEEAKKHGIKFCILSNTNKKKKAEKMSKKLEVPYIYFAKIVQENSENIAVIGDQILTDVLGANRSHMYSILVEPLAEKDIFVTRFNRLIERQILKKYKQK